MTTLRERVLSRIVIDPSGCLLWTGGTVRNGYGRIFVLGRPKMAHRVAYEMLNEPIPAGMQLDHLCRVRRCCSPAHLEPVTGRENKLRGQTVNAANAAKDQCDHGHPFSSANTYIWRGARHCRACRREFDRCRSQGKVTS